MYLLAKVVTVVHVGSAHFGAPAACLVLVYMSMSKSTLITSESAPASFSESSLSASSCYELDSGTLLMSSWSGCVKRFRFSLALFGSNNCSLF